MKPRIIKPGKVTYKYFTSPNPDYGLKVLYRFSNGNMHKGQWFTDARFSQKYQNNKKWHPFTTSLTTNQWNPIYRATARTLFPKAFSET